MKVPHSPVLKIHPYRGLFTNCWGEEMPPAKVAPSLHSLLRECLERKKIQNSTIRDFLARNPSIKRYNSAFNLLWLVLENAGVNPPQADTDQIADALIQLFRFSPAQAINAYSAVLLIPGVGGGAQIPPPVTAL